MTRIKCAKLLIFFLAFVTSLSRAQFNSRLQNEIDKILQDEFFRIELNITDEQEKEEGPKDDIVLLSKVGKKNNLLEVHNQIKKGNQHNLVRKCYFLTINIRIKI
jgi:hypothetical protein